MRALFRMAERNFWSLNSLVVEPIYVACREALRQLVEKLLQSRLDKSQLATLRAGTAGAAGIIIFAIALAVLAACWPSSRWLGNLSELGSPRDLVIVALANSVVLVAAYLAVAALVWAFADATMPQLRDFGEFPPCQDADRTWRIAHLSDIHVVGERYGFRIESGRAGPRGNERLNRLLALLDSIHASNPLDIILITGDMTDAGRSAEWSEFLDALTAYPRLAERVLILPGNHDLNIVDRANPARLDLPTSPNRKLRRLRFLSAADALHGERVRLIDRTGRCLAGSLSEALKPYRAEMAKFAEAGRPRLFNTLNELWASGLSNGAAAGPRRWSWHYPAGLKCGYAFFFHQRPGDDFRGASQGDRDCRRAVSSGLLDHRLASPRYRISKGGKGVVRTDRYRAGEWKLVRPTASGVGGQGGADARPPSY